MHVKLVEGYLYAGSVHGELKLPVHDTPCTVDIGLADIGHDLKVHR